MKELLRRFSYEPNFGFMRNECDNTGEIHIQGSDMFETLCGNVDTGQKQVNTDKMPTCGHCLETYNMIKNGKLRKDKYD